MASVKVKFRPSSIDGKEGSIYYQVIHNRVVRHIRTNSNRNILRFIALLKILLE